MIIGGLVLPEPQSWRERDGQVELSFLPSPNDGLSRAELVALRVGVLGLGSAERVQPVRSSVFPERDGWYRVAGVSVEPVLGVTEVSGGFRVQLGLVRLAATVRSTTVAHGGVVSNDHGANVITDSEVRGWVGFQYGGAVQAQASNPWAVVGDGLHTVLITNPVFNTSGQASVQADPVEATVGAVLVEAEMDGAWRTLPGTDVPAGVSSLRLSNGMVRVTVNPVGGHLSLQTIDELVSPRVWADPIARWEIAGTYGWTADMVEVVASARASSTVRLHLTDTQRTNRALLDVSLRRGDTSASCVWKSPVSDEWELSCVDTDGPVTATTKGWGVTWPADGETWLVGLPQAHTIHGAATVDVDVATQVFRFGLGANVGPAAGIPAAAYADEVIGRYYAQWWPTELVR